MKFFRAFSTMWFSLTFLLYWNHIAHPKIALSFVWVPVLSDNMLLSLCWHKRSYLSLLTFGWRRKVSCEQEDEIAPHLFLIPQNKELGEFSQSQILKTISFFDLHVETQLNISAGLKVPFSRTISILWEIIVIREKEILHCKNSAQFSPLHFCRQDNIFLSRH